ncbi:hypothetical protein BJY04DRAFT_184527 [Aspergillus karnatakaensis]|uniref:uncharacterized protein n=1 Tax=Aspergillus karnatakaensis TaxID=1810916 RepID=UPI003CCE03F8
MKIHNRRIADYLFPSSAPNISSRWGSLFSVHPRFGRGDYNITTISSSDGSIPS